jgi:YesN/AraC family two-component response regulator
MREKYLEEGFDDYLAKPLDKKELERVLKKFLNKQYERTSFEPLPDDLYEISDDVVEKINSEEIEK